MMRKYRPWSGSLLSGYVSVQWCIPAIIALNPCYSYNAHIFLCKRWKPKGFFQFEIIIVSSFCFIWIPMLWVYGHYNLFYSTSEWFDFSSDRQGSNFESCVWRTVSSQSSHHPQEVLLAQFSLYVHKGGLKPDSFHLIRLQTSQSDFDLMCKVGHRTERVDCRSLLYALFMFLLSN